MSEALEVFNNITKLYKENKYIELVNVLKRESESNEKKHYEQLLNSIAQIVNKDEEIPLSLFIQIVDDEKNLPIKKRISWLINWVAISPAIAHEKFYGEIYPSLMDTEEMLDFIYVYHASVLPRVIIEHPEKLDLIKRFEKIISTQVHDLDARADLFKSIIRYCHHMKEYEYAISLLLKNIDLFSSTSIWSDLYVLSLNSQNKEIIINAIASINSYIIKIDRQTEQLEEIKDRIKRFLREAFTTLKNEIKDIEEFEKEYQSERQQLSEEKRGLLEYSIGSQNKYIKNKFVVENEKALESDDVELLLQTVNQLTILDIISGSLHQKGLNLRKILKNYSVPIKESEQLKQMNKILEAKLLTLYIKETRDHYINHMEQFDEENPEYKNLMKDLVKEINKKVQNEYQLHKLKDIQEAKNHIFQLFKQEGIDRFLASDETLKNQLIIGEVTYRNFIEMGRLVKEDSKLEISSIDYSAAAIPFTVALEHTLEKYFFSEFKEYCERIEERVPQNVQDITRGRGYFSLGGFTFELAMPDYKRVSEQYFRHKFRNGYVIPSYSLYEFTFRGERKTKVDDSFIFVKDVTALSQLRNKVAHKDPISKNDADKIRQNIIGLDQEDIEGYRNLNIKILIQLLKDIRE
ncbi:hypothetical protein [Paenibacillus sp. LHD-38]|uniref:hypothetical protein n=1 Tax=Paenibacillus sp. LHD-38 TaxID=3072143 RepID=UPI00280EC54D|nr:hypothetical protein [Paenibacillus sp. LHD-38]MDQ8739245.1 hypothetical protein [Paenibacillus sp. LHD-38]